MTKIGVGYFLKAKVGEFENITKKGRNRRTMKGIVGYVQDVTVKKNLLFQFKDGNKKETSASSFLFFKFNRGG